MIAMNVIIGDSKRSEWYVRTAIMTESVYQQDCYIIFPSWKHYTFAYLFNSKHSSFQLPMWKMILQKLVRIAELK